MKKLMVLPAVLLIGGTLPALATSFSSDAFYVGAKDQVGNDYDYNDFVFTLSGPGLALNSNGTLSPPIIPGTGGTPFWNNLSGDGPQKNFGDCLYTTSPFACMAGAPINPSAEYLSDGGASVAFDFSGATGAVTFTLDAALHGDNDTLYWCNSGGCTPLDGTPPAITTSTFTPGPGDFWLALIDSTTPGSFTTTSPSVNGIYNFAAALDPSGDGAQSVVPEPMSFLLTGTGLIGLLLVRLRRRGHLHY
jgi:hypothetical protein